jgi:hypothetical protein
MDSSTDNSPSSALLNMEPNNWSSTKGTSFSPFPLTMISDLTRDSSMSRAENISEVEITAAQMLKIKEQGT